MIDYLTFAGVVIAAASTAWLLRSSILFYKQSLRLREARPLADHRVGHGADLAGESTRVSLAGTEWYRQSEHVRQSVDIAVRKLRVELQLAEAKSSPFERAEGFVIYRGATTLTKSAIMGEPRRISSRQQRRMYSEDATTLRDLTNKLVTESS